VTLTFKKKFTDATMSRRSSKLLLSIDYLLDNIDIYIIKLNIYYIIKNYSIFYCLILLLGLFFLLTPNVKCTKCTKCKQEERN